ncbi:MAG: autotransporter assembly complex protein TamA [Allorhizobium sp.]
MPRKSTLPSKSSAFRKAATAMTVAASFAACGALTRKAEAFEIFGITLFGKTETDPTIIDPVNYSISFDAGSTGKDLAETLENTALLVQDAETPVSGDLGLVIKARDDRDRLIATLYENARYGGVVTISINGVDLDALPPNPTFDHSAPVPVSIRVEPGAVFTLGAVTLDGDAAGLDPAAFDLVVGGDASSLLILKAGQKIVERLKAESRPLARLTARDVVADHETNTVDVTISVESGPVAAIGEVSVSGAKTVDAGFIRRYSLLNAGKPYSPDDLRKAGERLRKLGVFSSVGIREADKLAADGTIPVGITVSEGKHRYFGAGATVSSIDGLGLEGYWGHRNLFGQAESLRVEGAVGRLGETTDLKAMDYSAGITFVKPGAFFPSASLEASVKAARLNTTSYDADMITARIALAYELSDYDTVSAGFELGYADIDDAFGTNKYVTASIPIDFVRDTRDNKLNPTEGYNASLGLSPSYEIMGQTFFSSFEGSLSAYRALDQDDRIIVAGKLSLGTLFGTGDLKDIPATRRFFAGGGGSVRGYAFEEISPYNADNKATGGRSYAVASFETRVGITESIGLVPFVDVGTVSVDNIPDFSDIRMGAGLGLRYATAFGPLRLDVAVPVNRYSDGSQYGIYAGIGQSF